MHNESFHADRFVACELIVLTTIDGGCIRPLSAV